jgi:hypothetical protein
MASIAATALPVTPQAARRSVARNAHVGYRRLAAVRGETRISRIAE